MALTSAQTNSYAPDYIGYSADEVLYYRSRGRAPCSANVYQTMTIACDSGKDPIAYKNNVLSAVIGPTTIGSGKNGVSEVEIWGMAQGELINIINSALLLNH